MALYAALGGGTLAAAGEAQGAASTPLPPHQPVKARRTHDCLPSQEKLLVAFAAAVVAALAWWSWTRFTDSGPGEGFVNGNGRIEATEIDMATKLPGRIEDILVREGDFVTATSHWPRCGWKRWKRSATRPWPCVSRLSIR